MMTQLCLSVRQLLVNDQVWDRKYMMNWRKDGSEFSQCISFLEPSRMDLLIQSSDFGKIDYVFKLEWGHKQGNSSEGESLRH